MLLTIPAAVALAVIPFDVIKVLFERGHFLRADTEATSLALLIYAIGLPAFVLNKVFSPAFYAREDTKTPLRFAAISIAVNIASSFALFQFFGYAGIAAGTSIAAWTNTIQLGVTLWRRGDFLPDAHLLQRLPLILLASAGMGAVLYAGAQFLTPWFDLRLLASVSALAGLVVGGMLTYAILCQLTGAARYADIMRPLRRG